MEDVRGEKGKMRTRKKAKNGAKGAFIGGGRKQIFPASRSFHQLPWNANERGSVPNVSHLFHQRWWLWVWWLWILMESVERGNKNTYQSAISTWWTIIGSHTHTHTQTSSGFFGDIILYETDYYGFLMLKMIVMGNFSISCMSTQVQG